MWIKSLRPKNWVNMNHITHFRIEVSNNAKIHTHDVVAYLDTSMNGHEPREGKSIEGQARITVKRGNYEECEQFVNDQTFLQAAYQWIGYLVAGGVGAVLTFLFSRLGS